MARNVISFEKLCKRQQRGIVFEEKIDVRRGGRLDTTKNNLIEKVNDIIGRINQRGQVTGYYFGKVYVDQIGQNFDRKDSDTWNSEGINARWIKRSREGYDGLIVLTVIDEDAICDQSTTHQDFALELKQELLLHYRDDGRIRNHNFREGRRGDQGQQGRPHPGYAVYMAVKITEREQGGQCYII